MARTSVFPAQTIADYFLWKAQGEKKSVTNKKLQKLLYYAQAWSLVMRDKKLFNEGIEAWVHGPAVRDIYFEYKDFGFNPIKKKINEKSITSISAEVKEFLDEVWSVYGKYDAAYLELLTHSEKPWQDAREGLEPFMGSSNEITPASMKAFYSAKLEKSKTA
jgi:uncharacterized phage-associated protein